MRTIELAPPQVADRRATFSWRVDPPEPGLYRRTSFSLDLPEGVDVGRVPERAWWTVALLCLHSHWAFLRPCRVRLPVALEPGERATWRRLLHAEVVTLEAYRGRSDPALDVEIEDDGPRLSSWEPPDVGAHPGGDRCAVAFSGGKDSLLHAGLLCELTERPTLVTTTSPMPPLEDHASRRRRFVLEEVTRRRAVDLFEVRSDLRSTWENRFPRRLGYPVSVNETTDAFLYAAATMVVGVARGARHLFLASENEVSETSRLGGGVVQHPHFMYSAPTQRAVQALLEPLRCRYSSLTYALHSDQVQRLLWTRYADLRDLQYSCWRVHEDESACSRCSQCLRLALGALDLDDDPALLGVDLAKVLWANRRWDPVAASATGSHLPQDVVSKRLRGHAVRSLEAIPEARLARRLRAGRLLGRLSPAALRATHAFRALRRRVAGHDFGPRPGWRPGYLALYDPLLRDEVAAIFGAAFPADEPASYADGLQRVVALSDAITGRRAEEAARR